MEKPKFKPGMKVEFFLDRVWQKGEVVCNLGLSFSNSYEIKVEGSSYTRTFEEEELTLIRASK